MKIIDKIFDFLFGKTTYKCINCIHGNSTDNSTNYSYPCCDCDGIKYYEGKRFIFDN